jgi:hypothetical protein
MSSPRELLKTLNTFAGSLETGGSNFELPELLTFLE